VKITPGLPIEHQRSQPQKQLLTLDKHQRSQPSSATTYFGQSLTLPAIKRIDLPKTFSKKV
jgi:hypothetical protein